MRVRCHEVLLQRSFSSGYEPGLFWTAHLEWFLLLRVVNEKLHCISKLDTRSTLGSGPRMHDCQSLERYVLYSPSSRILSGVGANYDCFLKEMLLTICCIQPSFSLKNANFWSSFLITELRYRVRACIDGNASWGAELRRNPIHRCAEQGKLKPTNVHIVYKLHLVRIFN